MQYAWYTIRRTLNLEVKVLRRSIFVADADKKNNTKTNGKHVSLERVKSPTSGMTSRE